MKNLNLKLLKRFLKKRIKITESLFVYFLISGNIVFAVDSINIQENDEIKNTTQTINSEYLNRGTISVTTENGIKTQTGNITNEGIIKVSSSEKNINGTYGAEENGISNYENSPNFSVINNGTIIVNSNYKDSDAYLEVYTSGNGVSLGSYTTTTSNNILNNGIIDIKTSGEAGETADPNGYSGSFLYGSGNGVSFYALGDSTIETFINTGKIIGNITSRGGDAIGYSADGNANFSGNGISINSQTFIEVGQIKNKGKLMGKGEAEGGTSQGGKAAGNLEYSANGIILASLNILKTNDITNNGILQGKGKIIGLKSSSRSSGNGLVIDGYSNNDINGTEYFNSSIKNNGSILGYIEVDTQSNTCYESGSGLVLLGLTDGKINNNGVIVGNNSSINVRNSGGKGSIYNKGILAGENILTINTIGIKNIQDAGDIGGENNGIFILLNSDTTVNTIINGSGDESVINGIISGNDSSIQFSTLPKSKDVIINGAGVSKGALIIDKEASLENSIVNGYKTALYVENNNSFTGSNIIFNGGGVKGDTAVIKGDSGNNTITLSNNSIINGSTDLGDGDDKLNLDVTTQINGDLDGGAGTGDILSIAGSSITKANNNLNMLYDIKGFETININNGANVTLYETTKVSDANKINIEGGSQLNLRVDPTIKTGDSYTGHALYNNGNSTKLEISGELSKITDSDYVDNKFTATEDGQKNYDKVSILNIITNGLGKNSIIDFGNVNFNTENLWVKTDSILNNAVVNDSKVTISAEKDIFEIIKKVENTPTNPDNGSEGPTDTPTNPDNSSKNENLYVKLNEIYKGIYTGDERNFEALKDIALNYSFSDKNKANYTSVEDKLQMGTLLGYLRSVYEETPYSFSNEVSRKSINLFNNSVRDNDFKAKEDEWFIYGGLAHQKGDQEQTYYGRNYHGFDTSIANTEVKSKITGAYGQFEYGNTETLSSGILVGGTKSTTNIASSSLKGNALYLGGYLKKDINKFRLITGIGYQYSEYDSVRKTINQSYSKKYNDNTFSLYLDGKYSYEIAKNWYLIPNFGVSYTMISQEKIEENKSKALALNVDSKKFNIVEGTIGLDLKKEMIKEKGKHSITTGITYRSILKGNEANHLTANYGGKDFEILIPHKNRDQISLGAKYEVQLNNGMFYNVKGNYFLSTDSKENTHKNSDKNEWRVGVGIGYRFNSIKDLTPETIVITPQPKENKIILSKNNNFDFNSANLTSKGKEEIKQFADNFNAEELRGTLIIEGHTDSIGKDEYNQKLSERRAKSVEKELRENITNPNIQYQSIGYGETKPIADNITEEGRAKNRRVEINFNSK